MTIEFLDVFRRVGGNVTPVPADETQKAFVDDYYVNRALIKAAIDSLEAAGVDLTPLQAQLTALDTQHIQTIATTVENRRLIDGLAAQTSDRFVSLGTGDITVGGSWSLGQSSKFEALTAIEAEESVGIVTILRNLAAVPVEITPMTIPGRIARIMDSQYAERATVMLQTGEVAGFVLDKIPDGYRLWRLPGSNLPPPVMSEIVFNAIPLPTVVTNYSWAMASANTPSPVIKGTGLNFSTDAEKTVFDVLKDMYVTVGAIFTSYEGVDIEFSTKILINAGAGWRTLKEMASTNPSPGIGIWAVTESLWLPAGVKIGFQNKISQNYSGDRTGRIYARELA